MEMPHLRYVAFSYAAGLTERDNGKFRDLITSQKYQELWGDKFKTRKIGEVMANARRAMSKLVMPALPPEGTLTFVATPEEAADGVDFVQESAPERIELKQMLLQRASAVAPAHVVFGSSTSGLLPATTYESCGADAAGAARCACRPHSCS